MAIGSRHVSEREWVVVVEVGGVWGGEGGLAASIQPPLPRDYQPPPVREGKQCMKRASNEGDEKLLTVQEWMEGRGRR